MNRNNLRHAPRASLLHVAAACLLCSTARADAKNYPVSPWAIRVAFGVGYIEDDSHRPGGLDAGVGGSVDLAWHWTAKLRIGLAYEIERYKWSGYGAHDENERIPAFPDESSIDQRLLAFVRWDPLAPYVVSPFVAAGVAEAWTKASLHSEQCGPRDPSGLVPEGAAGADVSFVHSLRIGLEWRVAPSPGSGRTCFLKFIPGEPPDSPLGLRQRLLLALTFDELF